MIEDRDKMKLIKYIDYIIMFLMIITLLPVAVLFVCIDKHMNWREMRWRTYMYNDDADNLMEYVMKLKKTRKCCGEKIN